MVSGAVAVPLVVPRQQFIEPGLPKGVIDTNTGKEFIFCTVDRTRYTISIS